MDTIKLCTLERCKTLLCSAGNAEAPPAQLKEEKMEAVEAEPTTVPTLSSADPPTVPSPAPAGTSPVRSASVPLMPACVKEEPGSPVQLPTQLEPPAGAHSTTSDLPPAPAAASSPGTLPPRESFSLSGCKL